MSLQALSSHPSLTARISGRLPRVSVALGAPPLSRWSRISGAAGAVNVTPSWAQPAAIPPTVIPIHPGSEQAMRLAAGMSYAEAGDGGVADADAGKGEPGFLYSQFHDLPQEINSVVTLYKSVDAGLNVPEFAQTHPTLLAQWAPLYKSLSLWYQNNAWAEKKQWLPDLPVQRQQKFDAMDDFRRQAEPFKQALQAAAQQPDASQAMKDAGKAVEGQRGPGVENGDSFSAWLDKNGRTALKWTAIGGAVYLGTQLLIELAGPTAAMARTAMTSRSKKAAAMSGMRRHPVRRRGSR